MSHSSSGISLHSATTTFSSPGRNYDDPEAGSSSRHDNDSYVKNTGCQRFLNTLSVEFNEKIISFLDKKTREAFELQSPIEDPHEFAHVKSSITHRVIDLLLEHYDGEGTAPLRVFENIITILAAKYPYMFAEDPFVIVNGEKIRRFNERGTGGYNGLAGTYIDIALQLFIFALFNLFD